jgi:hypothetical protein
MAPAFGRGPFGDFKASGFNVFMVKRLKVNSSASEPLVEANRNSSSNPRGARETGAPNGQE